MTKDVVAGWIDDKDLRNGDVERILGRVGKRKCDGGQRRVVQENVRVVEGALVDERGGTEVKRHGDDERWEPAPSVTDEPGQRCRSQYEGVPATAALRWDDECKETCLGFRTASALRTVGYEMKDRIPAGRGRSRWCSW